MIYFAAFFLIFLFARKSCDEARTIDQLAFSSIALYVAVGGMAVSLFICAATKAVYYVYPMI